MIISFCVEYINFVLCVNGMRSLVVIMRCDYVFKNGYLGCKKWSY